MTTTDFITELFVRVDDALIGIRKHSQARLYPSEIVTLGLLFALKGGSERAFYRWVHRDLLSMFPCLPERTRLFELFATHQEWTRTFLAEPTVLGVADSYGIELIHPRREGRTGKQIGRKGLSNQRWIVGGKLGYVLNQWGRIVDWDAATANAHDQVFHPLIRQFVNTKGPEITVDMIVLTDPGFHAKEGDPINMKVCPHGTWNVRMVVESVLSMLTIVCHFKKARHRVWAFFRARLAFVMAAYNICVQWRGLQTDEKGFIPLSIAEFSL